jgi:hypothetical protein
MESKIVNVIKSSGKLEPFSIEKLKRSLKRSGANDNAVNDIAHEVEAGMYEGMTTKKIYQLAFRLLHKKYKPVAAKYSIKKAVMELGPSGFPFERYISLLLRGQGYDVRINQFLQGLCVKHEVDIIAENENTVCIIECKYHNLQGIVCDIKIPLYVNSRFLDIRSAITSDHKEYECWIVTNTKFSSDSIQYGNCSGQHLLSWDYPANDNLKELIDRHKLYPISCLTSLTKREKQLLLEKGVILCKDLAKNTDILATNNIGGDRLTNIINEAIELTAA